MEFWQELRAAKNESLILRVGGEEQKVIKEAVSLEDQVYELGQQYGDINTAN